MYKSKFTYTRQASVHKSHRSKSVAARLAPSERTVSPSSSSSLAAVAAASASLKPAAAASSSEDKSDFPPKDYKNEIMKLCEDGIKKWLKFMPALSRERVGEWDLAVLLSRCDALYTKLDPSIRLIPSFPQNLLQRKKTLACNIAFSVCPYNDVNPKKTRSEFNRIFGAQRNGPVRLTEEYVPAAVKAHVQKMKKKSGEEDAEMGN